MNKLFVPVLLLLVAAVVLGFASPVVLAGSVLLTIYVGQVGTAEESLGTTLAAATILLFIYGTTNAPAVLCLAVSAFCGVVVCIAARRVKPVQGGGNLHLRVMQALIAAMLSITLFRSFATENLQDFRRDTLPMVIVGSTVFFAATRIREASLYQYARAILAFGLFEAFHAVVEYFGGVRWAPWPTYRRDGFTSSHNALLDSNYRAEGLLGHPIPLAVLFTVCAVLVWNVKPGPRTQKRMAMTAIFVGAIALTGTRSALLALGVALAVSIVAPRLTFRARSISLAATGAGLLAYLSSSKLQGYVKNINATLLDSGSFTHRSGAFESIPKLLDNAQGLAYLFGNGVGSEARLFDQGLLQTDNFHVIDNQFVSTLAWIGLVGLIILTLLFVMVFLSGSSIVVVLGVVMVVYFNTFDVLRWQGPAAVAYFVFGLAAAASLTRGAPEAHLAPTRRPELPRYQARGRASVR